MPRVRAGDYDDKTRAIMDAAAALFARTGYPNAKMQDIAKACGASKSMLYHYFQSKDDLLFAMLKEHLELLIASLEQTRDEIADPQDRFAAFVRTYVQKSAQARRRNIVATFDLKYLPPAQQTPLLQLESRVIHLTSEILAAVNPRLDKSLYKPYSLMLVGTLNWTDTWYRSGGPMKQAELCDRLARLFLRGFLAE
ncbi:MAG: TetR family transcriptional regulator [Burkholderiales bacterium]|nr:TetR family transcriptional regulator [Burkholderiales bacterium]OJX08390.1 MAG: hypothetical protein BGO72_03255 [Burkholderiales bacterium 70-64]